MADLHVARISEGFLPTLGTGFLTRLYARVVASPDAFAYVAVADDEARVDGFAACALDLRALYRSFLLRDGAVAGVAAAPRLLRSWRKVAETLRYPATTVELPDAEVLSVAVAADAAGHGAGASLVDAVTQELASRDVRAAKVVTGAANDAATRMYRKCGFEVAQRLQVHGGTESVVLVWHAGARDEVAP
jgi:ribosomal protein S18 acetylase RimI-like enzyme